MSLHDKCAPLVQEKALLAQQCRDIVWGACEVRPGDTVKAQKLKAHRNLGVSYLKVKRAWDLRGGAKLLKELREADQKWRLQYNAISVAARLERLERAIERATADNPLPNLAGLGPGGLSLVKSPA
jgi:hypothetical protein